VLPALAFRFRARGRKNEVAADCSCLGENR
jgi:hypothetical protein